MSSSLAEEHRILILDFGSQFTQLIARRIREIGVYCEIVPWDVSEEKIRAFAPRGIILSGSSESTLEGGSPRAVSYVFESGLPLFGICYGMQTMALQLGGDTKSCGRREFGAAVVSQTATPGFLATVNCDSRASPQSYDVWMSHGDQVSKVPEGFIICASTPTCECAAMCDPVRKMYATQFHPEVNETRQGVVIFEQFLRDVCKCEFHWTPAEIVNDLVALAREQVEREAEGGDVLLGLSGGVDSSVVAALLYKAIGPRLKCVLVDTGLMRKDEARNVQEAFAREHPQLHVTLVDASEQFLSKLKGVSDPEAKRKIIGAEFIAVFDQTAKQFTNVKMLAQGTIYPDVIESAASGTAMLIKSHHNVGGLPESMKMKLIEPVRKLFKDEVRRIGEELGLPHDFVWRHPFPGPGLGVRILGEVTREKADKLREADYIYLEELRKCGWYEKTSQCFAVLLPCKSVAVKGDARYYDEVIALRAVETIDFMTARVAEFPMDFLKTVSRRICNEVDGVSRVVYDLTDKPPGTIEWE